MKQFLIAIFFATILASCNTCAVKKADAVDDKVVVDSTSTATQVVEIDTTAK